MFEIGSSLRDARVRKQVDFGELEAETKIRAKYLRALEDERFDLLPGDTYVKGFLRIYAERLGLDGQLYVDEYSSRYSASEQPAPTSRPRRRGRNHGRLQTHAVVVALAGIVAVTVLVIAAWRLGGDDGGGETMAVQPAVSQTVTDAAAAESAAADAPPVQLLVTARRGTSRVEVRRGSATGELLWEGTLSKGDEQPFEGETLWVFIGKGQNVALTLNGDPMPDLGKGATTLVVTEDGIEPVAVP